MIAVCEEITVTRSSAEFRVSGERWTSFWEATGDATIPSGTVKELVGSPFGLTAKLLSVPSLDPGTEIVVQLIGGPDDTAVAEGYFVVPMEGLSDELWLDSDDQLTEEPC